MGHRSALLEYFRRKSSLSAAKARAYQEGTPVISRKTYIEIYKEIQD